MNVKLLRKIQKHISEEPKRFIMGTWCRRDGDRGWSFHKINDFGLRDSPYPECGTAACIGGWAMLLSGENPDDTLKILMRVMELLQLDMEEAKRLCAVDYWGEFLPKFTAASTPTLRAEIACERIDRFIKTKGAV